MASSENRQLNISSLLWPDVQNNKPLFLPRGNYGGLSVNDEDNDIKVFYQHHGSAGENDLCAAAPSLPLFKPNIVNLPWTDQCQESSRQNHENIDFKDFRRQLKNLKISVNRSKQKKEELKKYRDELLSGNLQDDLTSKSETQPKPIAPQWFSRICNRFPDLFESKPAMPFNEDYSGGCLSYEKLNGKDEGGILMFPHGKDLSSLRLQTLSVSDQTVRKAVESESLMKLGCPILEVQSSVNQNQLLCLTRSYTKCCLYSSVIDNCKVTNWTKETDLKIDSGPTSICTSPYIHGEWLTCNESGTVKLYNADRIEQTVCENHQPRFLCHSYWKRVHYGGHPRLITLADRTGVESLDIRTQTSRNSTDLFTLPNQFLRKEERIMCTKQHSTRNFYHFIVTDYNLFMVDERFPGHPVISWGHSLTSPPQYIDIVSNACEGNDILLLSSQSKPETQSFQFSLSGQIVQSTSPPWRISRFDDFMHLDSVMYPGYDALAVEKRLNSSLIGVCGIIHVDSRGFTAVQLNSFGDVFTQSYTPSGGMDKSYCAGPGSHDLTICDEDKETIHSWLEEIDKQIKDATFKISSELEQRVKSCDVSESFRSSSCHDVFPHLMCVLCSLQSEPPVVPGDKLSDICQSCGNTLEESCNIKQSESSNKVFPCNSTQVVGDVTLHKAKEFTDPESELYLKLWNGDDIVQEVQKARELSRSMFIERQGKRPQKRRRRLSESSTASGASVRSSSSVYIPGFSFESPARIFSPKHRTDEKEFSPQRTSDGVRSCLTDTLGSNDIPQEGAELNKETNVDEHLDQLDSFSSSLFSSTPWNPSNTKSVFGSHKSPRGMSGQGDASYMFTPQSPIRAMLSPVRTIKERTVGSPRKGKPRKSSSFVAGF